MSDVTVVAATALASSALTATATLANQWFADRLTARREKRNAQLDACGRLITHSGLIAFRVATLRVVADKSMHAATNLDAIETAEYLNQDMTPIFDAWSSIRIICNPKTVETAEEVITCVTKILEFMAPDASGSSLLNRLVSDTPRASDEDSWKEAQTRLARARIKCNDILRNELGESALPPDL